MSRKIHIAIIGMSIEATAMACMLAHRENIEIITISATENALNPAPEPFRLQPLEMKRFILDELVEISERYIGEPKISKNKQRNHRHEYRPQEPVQKGGMITQQWVCSCGRNMRD